MSANIAGNAIKLRMFDTFAGVEREWRAFEKHAIMTPYQQFDWLEPWYRHVGMAETITPLIIYGEANGSPAFLWPLGLQRVHGLRVCRWLGGKQCNYNFGLYDPEILPQLDGDGIKSFLRKVCELAGGIDVFELYNQPQTWNGIANPFAEFEHQASPSPCYRMDLQQDFEALEKARRNPRSIQTLRRKTRKLAETHGDTRLESPADQAAYEKVFQSFLDQRAVRFGEMGVPNIFAEPGLGDFLKEVSRPVEGGKTPPLVFHALFAGDGVCATYAGLSQNGHYSCFVNSVNLVDYGKFSPGDIILTGVIEEYCTEGYSGLDLGMGTERYKLSWCEEDILFDCFIPITMLGILQTAGIRTMLKLKRAIRSNPRLWTFAKSIRKHLRGS